MGNLKILSGISIVFLTLSLISNITSAEDLTVNSNITWISGEYTYDNVTITNSATLIFDGKVILNATNLTIESGSTISADGKGYGAYSGPDAGVTTSFGGGGGYGGRGGDGSHGAKGGITYGSAIAPVDLGSGGGGRGVLPGLGGGAIRLIISENGLKTTRQKERTIKEVSKV